jgi:hypothetical protein
MGVLASHSVHKQVTGSSVAGKEGTGRVFCVEDGGKGRALSTGTLFSLISDPIQMGFSCALSQDALQLHFLCM